MNSKIKGNSQHLIVKNQNNFNIFPYLFLFLDCNIENVVISNGCGEMGHDNEVSQNADVFAHAALNADGQFVYAVDENGKQLAVAILIDGAFEGGNTANTDPDAIDSLQSDGHIVNAVQWVGGQEECLTEEVFIPQSQDKIEIKTEETDLELVGAKQHLQNYKGNKIIKSYKVRKAKKSKSMLKELKGNIRKQCKILQSKEKFPVRKGKIKVHNKKHKPKKIKRKRVSDRTFPAPKHLDPTELPGK